MERGQPGVSRWWLGCAEDGSGDGSDIDAALPILVVFRNRTTIVRNSKMSEQGEAQTGKVGFLVGL